MIYYCGAGGNDLNAGTSWATRLLTLNACEDAHGGGTPKPAIAAGDSVYVGPGVYRELLTCDVSGLAGQPITYVGDTTGEHTDGVGGVVRISGSNADLIANRGQCIFGNIINYRTFRGFYLDACLGSYIHTQDCVGWIVEDCVVLDGGVNNQFFYSAGAGQSSSTIRRCVIICGSNGAAGFGSIAFSHTVSVNNTGHLIQDCIISGPFYASIATRRVGGITVRNCLMFGGGYGVLITNSLAVGQTVTVNNCSMVSNSAFSATVLGEIVEDFNNLWGQSVARVNVAVGANSTAYPPVFQPPVLNSGVNQISGFQLPWTFGSLSQWSQLRAIAGTGAPTEDLFGIARPVTAALNSWGPIQFQQITQDTATVRSGTLSQEFTTAGRRQLIIPVQAVNTTITVYVYREVNYAGINPQMILKQSGQADIVITDAGGLGVWNALTHAWIPASVPTWIVIELVSNNTAAAGAFAVYFDDLTVSPLGTGTQDAWLTNEQPVNYAEELAAATAAFSPVGGEIVKG